MAYRTYSPSNGFLVAQNGTGDFTTIAACMAAITAASLTNVTVYLQTGTYTENFTLPSGISLVSFHSNEYTPTVIIIGELTYTATGNATCSGIQFRTNSNFAINFGGAGISNLTFENCIIEATNNNAINFTNSNSSSTLLLTNSKTDITNSSYTLYAMTSSGTLILQNVLMRNSSGSSIASNNSSGTVTFLSVYSNMLYSNSGNGIINVYPGSVINPPSGIPLSFNSTSFANTFTNSQVFGNGVAGIYIGSGSSTITESTISSTGTYAIDGTSSGTLIYSDITFTNTSSINPVLIKSPVTTFIGNLVLGSPLPVTSGGTGVSTLTAYSLLAAGTTSTSSINGIGPGSTSGIPLIAKGATSEPAFGTAVVAGGGTGVTTFANTSALLCSGTTATGNIQNVASVATGQVLISGGTSTLPSYSAYPQISGLGIGASPGSTAGLTFDGSNFMNAYVASTWTPTLDGSVSGTTTYTFQNGYYIKIGKLVWALFEISISAATGTANATLGGLPFTVANQTNGSVPFPVTFNGSSWAFPAITTQIVGLATLNTTTAVLLCQGSSVGQSNLQMTNAALVIRGTIVYQSST